MPGQQALVEQRGIPIGEGAEVGAVRIGVPRGGRRVSTQARETVWWYFCGARSYAAMRWIQSQILVVASGMPYRRTARKARWMCCRCRNCPLGPVISGRSAASSVGGGAGVVVRHQQASCRAVTTAW